jgi:chromosome segregation ATPase
MSDEVDELKERIEELEQERDELQGELDDHSDELSNREQGGYDRAMLEMESKIEHSFNAGFDGGIGRNTHKMKFKLFLDYKMEQRL